MKKVKENSNSSTSKIKSFSTNRIFFPLLFITFSIILEFANSLYLGFSVLPTYFLFDFSVMCVIAGIIYVVCNKHAMCVLFCLFIAIQAIMAVVNATLYGLFGEILSLSSLTFFGEAAAAFSFSMIDWGSFALNVALFAVVLTIGILLIKYNHKTFKMKHSKALALVLAVFILIEGDGIALFALQAANLKSASAEESEIISSDDFLFKNLQFKNEAYKKFGFWGFYSKEIFGLIFPESVSSQERENCVAYIDEGYVEGNSSAKLYGQNLIVILMESLDVYSIDPIFTPTLYSMYNGYHSFALKNFHTNNRTNHSEGITLMGGYPKNSTIVNACNSGYEFQYSLPNLFKAACDDDCVTNYVHGDHASFYNRDVTFGSDGIGFDNLLTLEKYTGDKKLNKWGDWIPDQDLFENFVDTILPKDKRFLTYFTSISTHGSWTYNKTYFSQYYEAYEDQEQEYAEWLKENGFVYPEDKATQSMLKVYKAGTMDLEAMVNMLLNELKERGLADNTSIVFFADHNSYYHNLAYKMRGITKDYFVLAESYHVPAMIYSPQLFDEEGVVFDGFCSTYNLLPTICELYGLASNTNLFLGQSLLSDEIENAVFVSHLGGIFTDKVYSSNLVDFVKQNEDVTDEEIEDFVQNALVMLEKQAMLEKIFANGINGNIKIKKGN